MHLPVSAGDFVSISQAGSLFLTFEVPFCAAFRVKPLFRVNFVVIGRNRQMPTHVTHMLNTEAIFFKWWANLTVIPLSNPTIMFMLDSIPIFL
ncbi:hypothetical protein HanPI659440_Chr15g0583541 [Helianthus annuus]|nr:hypothetical protein HanPI659440_Chr15g0583541 [Helianthus annuus]